MSGPKRAPRPTVLRGGNSAYPNWDKVDDDDVADCDTCEGWGEVWLRDGLDTCRACRGTGKEVA